MKWGFWLTLLVFVAIFVWLLRDTQPVQGVLQTTGLGTLIYTPQTNTGSP